MSWIKRARVWVVGLTVCVKVLWGLGFRVRVYLLVLVSGIKRARVLGVRVNDLCQGFRGLGLRVRVNGYGVEDSLRCGVCGSMFRGARV